MIHDLMMSYKESSLEEQKGWEERYRWIETQWNRDREVLDDANLRIQALELAHANVLDENLAIQRDFKEQRQLWEVSRDKFESEKKLLMDDLKSKNAAMQANVRSLILIVLSNHY